MKRPTIDDVARKSGVSKGTVSAVLNNRDTVSETTRAHIIKVMGEMEYRPRGPARNLKGTKPEHSIGLIIRELDNPFYTSIAMGVKKYANAKNYVLFLASSESDHKNEEKISQLLTMKEVSGVIIAPVISGSVEIEHLFRLRMINYPFVMLEEVQGIQANVVSINNIRATTEAVKYLIHRGYKDIIHFSGPQFASHTHERITGFRNAFSESKLVFNQDLIVTCGAHFHNGFEKGINYFQNINPARFPIAVLCYNDVVAMGLVSALQRLGLNIPDQVSVIGNDDIEIAKHWSPALTTISTPLTELGEKAAEILINNIESESTLAVEKIFLDAQLVVRETTL